MNGKTIFEACKGKDNIESVQMFIKSICITLKSEDEIQIHIDDDIQAIYQNKKQLEIIFKEDPKLCFDALNDCMNQKEKLSIKSIVNRIMDVLGGSLIPLIPMLITAAMFKTIVSLLGPDMLNVLPVDSDLYTLFTFVGDAGFYFFPVVVGYTAAKTFGVTPVLGMFLGGILMHPSFIDMAAKNIPFSVYGISIVPQNYSGTILPVILSCWVMSYIERFFNKYIPEAIKVVFAPLCTILVMLPLAFIILAPIGNIMGNYLCTTLLKLGNMGGIVSILTIAILGALWEFIIMGGLHWLFISSIFVILAQNGVETIIVPMCGAAAFSVGGMCLGAALREKSGKDRSATFSYMIAQVVGGVTEPGLYGIGVRYKKPFLGMMIGGFVGSLFAGIVHLKAYNFLPVANFLCIFDFAGGSTMNMVNGILSCIIGFVVAAIATYIIGISEK